MTEIIGHIGRAQTLTAELSTPQTITGSLCGGAAHGIPTGGEPGQGLIKVSDADYDVKWMDILPEDTASGSVASFPDGSDDLPMGVVVDIDPVQDLHGYDNPWPGGGGVNKANLDGATNTSGQSYNLVTSFDLDSEIITISGTITPTTNYIQYRFAVFPNIQNGLGLKAFNISSGAYADIFYWDGTKQTVVIIVRGLTAKQENNLNIKFHMVAYEGSTAPTSWTPYSNICPISGWSQATISHSGADTSNPTEHEIPFSTEVYGGTLNVETGELVVTHQIVDMGTLTWSGNQRFTATVSDSLKTVNGGTIPNWACSSLKVATPNAVYANTVDYAVSFYGVNLIQARANSITDATSFKAAMNGVQLVYELAAPITLTLTPVEIRSLLGDNNVWADTGNTTVTYLADVQKYIDKKISAAVAAMS